MSTECKESIFLVSDEILTSENAILVMLRNPYSGGASCFLLSGENKKLCEIQGFDEKYRSWFIKDKVCPDGCIRISTPYNPVFLILPYLMEASRNVPLSHLLEDDEFPSMVKLANIVDDLSCVADRKGPVDLNVWCYNEKSTLDWLSAKTEKLAEILEDSKEKPSETCIVSSDKESYRILAYGILCECLNENIRTKLRTHLGLPDPTVAEITGVISHLNKKQKTDEASSPTKQVSSTIKQSRPPKQTAKEKALANSAKGSKSIMSFFAKKS